MGPTMTHAFLSNPALDRTRPYGAAERATDPNVYASIVGRRPEDVEP
jgi:hypothetical protein